MPRRATQTLAWSAERETYELRVGDQVSPVAGDTWARWLDAHGSCAFHGRTGRLTLLKEARKGGAGYWYAYRRQGKRTAKRYAGRSAELTFARLEELAQALDAGGEQPRVPQLQVGAVPQEAGGAGSAASEPLLAPKLQPPRLPGTLVRRERLLLLLDAGRERKLTLVSAPAGSGKTTLVRQWLAESGQQGCPPTVVWLSLDRGDDDPLRFWRYLTTASRALGPVVGARSLPLLEAPMAVRSPLEMIVAAFINELTRAGGDGILVLDDYHVITTPLIHQTLAFLLDHLPLGLHLLLISRTTPPLPLARLRAVGDIAEIEAPDLRFSDAETAAFLRQATTLVLPPGDIARIDARIEGWAAGLRLLALALEGRQDAGEIEIVLAGFLAGRRGVGEYFVAEVLNHQPAPAQLFVLQTSFLGSLTASLCDSVTGRTNSQAMLELLDQAGLFLAPLDGAGLWYRYHALFATAMQSEARRRLGESAVRDLLEHAGRWYEGHAMLGDAIDAAFAAGNAPRAAGLIERVVERQLSYEQPELHSTPEYYTLQRWLTQLPEALLEERPLLNLALAIALLFTCILEMRPPTTALGREIERLLGKAERGLRASGETGRLGQVFAFRSLAIRQQGEIAAALDWARAALDLLPPHELAWRNVCVSNLGIGAITAGDLSSAAALFGEARAMCESLGNDGFARANTGMLGWVYVEQHELHRAAALFRQLLAEARRVDDLDDIGRSLQALAEIALCWNDLDAAWAQAGDVVELTRHYPHEPCHVGAVLILAHVEQARGLSEAALARCAALLAGRKPAMLPAERQLTAAIDYVQARIALAAGDLAAAQRWRATRPIDLQLARVAYEREVILLARVQMAEGDPGAALRLLESLLPGAEAAGRGRVALEMQVPLALTRAACGQRQAARQTLATALAAARLANAQRVFLDEGEPIAALLRATLPSLHDRNLAAFARTLLRATAGPSSAAAPATTEPLSPQERRVLRLLAAGRSNRAIAGDLVVSVNTVKAHVKSIYRKLDVGNRLEAAAAARRLGLL